jgi:alpha-beta hydrolase superfamily lysophospholipase
MIPTPDGEKLSAFYIRAPKERSQKNITILMFHGNAGNIGHRVPIARMFVQRMGCSVFMLEYRGYGLSTGSPDESGLMIDAQTAFDYIRERAETRNNDIVVFGQSLGGAVSVQLVAKNQNDKRLIGLVLENTFMSMRKLIPQYAPLFATLNRANFCKRYPTSKIFDSSLSSSLAFGSIPPFHYRSPNSLPFWSPG